MGVHTYFFTKLLFSRTFSSKQKVRTSIRLSYSFTFSSKFEKSLGVPVMFDLAISDLVSFLVHNAVSGRRLLSWLSNTNGWRCWYPSTGIEGLWLLSGKGLQQHRRTTASCRDKFFLIVFLLLTHEEEGSKQHTHAGSARLGS